MRLSTDQIQAIRQAATDSFGQGTAQDQRPIVEVAHATGMRIQ